MKDEESIWHLFIILFLLVLWPFYYGYKVIIKSDEPLSFKLCAAAIVSSIWLAAIIGCFVGK